MWFRTLISVVLIALGIASPWLVRDWLDWRESGRSTEGLMEKVAALPGRLGDALREAVPSGSESDGSTGSSREPYPVASNTMRVLRGFLPGSDESASLPDFPLPISEKNGGPVHRRPAGDSVEVSEQLRDDLAALGLEPGDPIFIRVFKEEEELELWMRPDGERRYTLFRVYRLTDWSGRLGPKTREGDGQTPEGFYSVGAGRLRPDTRHHLGMDLGYPNAYDRHHGRTGGGLLIHGGERSGGSYALSQGDMTELYALAEAALEAGQSIFRVNAFPFRMTDDRMAKEWKRQPDPIAFWTNLKEGYDFFENVNFPPDVRVREGRYAFRLH